MIAYLRAEPGGEVVRQLLQHGANVCLAHAINRCEVYYDVIRVSNIPTANTVVKDLVSDGVIIHKDLGVKFWKQVGRLKASGRMSWPTAFVLRWLNMLAGSW
jgi:hypothetical protein